MFIPKSRLEAARMKMDSESWHDLDLSHFRNDCNTNTFEFFYVLMACLWIQSYR